MKITDKLNMKSQNSISAIPTIITNQKTFSLAPQDKKIPPVASWKPTRKFDMDLIIKSNGEWWHEGVKITRKKLVDTFASILFCEEVNGKKNYFLQSPIEKAQIVVEDVPLMVIAVTQFHEQGNTWIQFTTNTGDIVNADAHNPIVMRTVTHNDGTQDTRPYITVRDNLDAFINRNTFYHLLDFGNLVEDVSGTVLILESGGVTFTLSSDN